MAYEQLAEELAAIKPVLDSAERAIEVATKEGSRIVFRLSGFCGGCGCSESYKDGLRDLVSRHCPEYTEVEFIES